MGATRGGSHDRGKVRTSPVTEVCEVWSAGQLAALVIGTTVLASAAVLAVILGCVWLAQSWPGLEGGAVVDNLAQDPPAGLGKAALGNFASRERVE